VKKTILCDKSCLLLVALPDWFIDYRKLNSVAKKDVYPLPLIEECIDTLSGNEWFSKLNANSAYNQVKVRECDKE
jgi:hypothetical protein